MPRFLGFRKSGRDGEGKKGSAQSGTAHPPKTPHTLRGAGAFQTTPHERKRDRLLRFVGPLSRSTAPYPSSLALRQVPPTSGSPPSQQPALPGPPSSVLQLAPSSSPSSSVLQQPATHVPSTTGGNDLWTKAYHQLPDELQQTLGANKPGAADKLQTLQSVLEAVTQVKEANMANRLQFKWGDKEIDLQATADRLVGWITKFREVGDIAVQYDPVHAALPWAGVRFILIVSCTATIHTLRFQLTLLNLACCWRPGEIRSRHCWNGTSRYFNRTLCHIRAVVSNK